MECGLNPFSWKGGKFMSHYLIVLVNRSMARFFTLEQVEFPELESSPRLTARTELENKEIIDRVRA